MDSWMMAAAVIEEGGDNTAAIITAIGGLITGTLGATASLVIALRRSSQRGRTVIVVTDPEQAKKYTAADSTEEPST